MKHKRLISSLLIVTLSVSILFASAMISFSIGYADSFHSSFEEEQTAPLTNTADTDSEGAPRVSGLGLPVVASSASAADITAKVTATEGTAGHNCTPDKLTDSNSATKYITPNKTAYVIYTLDREYVVQKYTVTTANDSAQYPRHPKNWTVYGSNDKTTWYPLDSRQDQGYTENYHVSEYTCANSTPFRYYKMDITANAGDTYTQFADWNLFGYAALAGDITADAAVEGTASRNDREVIGNLKDSNSATKYLNSWNGNVDIIYTLPTPQAVTAYSLTSANDEPARDPVAWTVYGSNDKSSWTPLGSQSGQSFVARYQTNFYTLENTVAYQYYKLNITANNGSTNMMQLADWNLATGRTPTAGLQTTLAGGPSNAWSSFSDRGWTGSRSLKISSSQTAGEAYGYNILYQDLNLYVTEETRLSYMIYPDLPGSDDVADYDHEYTSMHIALDLKFTDGTYLSDLKATDQNGDLLNPKAQGESRALYTKQWNTITAKLGTVAKGKVIDQILVGFEKDSLEAEGCQPFLAYIDDITIEKKAEKVYKNQLSYTMTRRGSQSSDQFSRGLTFPATATPNGFNLWTMSTVEKGTSKLFNFQPGNDITHFTISHQPSYWMGDRGTFQFMTDTTVDVSSATAVPTAAQRKQDYDRDTLMDQANYLKVNLADGTTVELVPTDHAASIRFTFDKNAVYKNILFDSVNAESNCQFTFYEDGSFSGRTAHTGAGMRYMYFYGNFSETPSATKVVNGDAADAMASFSGDTVVMSLATSFISVEQAKHNLELEIGDKTFKQVYAETEAAWLDIMDRIEIKGGSEEELITFWSNLYRAYLYPTMLHENQGTNEEPDWVYVSPYEGSNDAPIVKDGQMYYNNGFWDVARTTPGLYALLTPTAYGEYLDGFVQHYTENGWIPRWSFPAGSDTMVGTHSDAMFADAYLRGIEFDYENAYLSALRNGSAYSDNTSYGRKQTETSNYLGYANTTDLRQGFSWSMESYINDAAIAKLAAARGDTDIATYYGNRALYYTKLFNEEADFFIGKTSTGGWFTEAENFDPTVWNRDYTETNGWNYAFHIPYDGQGLANLYGGTEELEAKLDEFFGTDGSITLGGERLTSSAIIHEMREQREVKLGEYGHSNQPSHHIIYMYNYANAPEKTQYYTRDILDRLYVGASIGQGYLGDEDNGEASAWYLQAAMGIFPVNVGSGNYTLTSPLFEEVTLHLENGNDLTITAKNNSAENVYIQSVTVDGKPYNSTTISHSDFINAKEIVFEMGSAPSDWGKNQGAQDSLTTGNEVAEPMEDLLDHGTVTLSAGDATAVTDNNGGTYTTLGTTASLTVSYESPKIVEMYTISNYTSTEKVPTTAALYGSNDGSIWTKLDERTDITFKWSRYVEPFAVANETAYKYYRLDLSTTASAMEISELELYGHPYKAVTKDELQSVLTAAKAIDQSRYSIDLTDLNTAIANGEAVYTDESATNKAVAEAISILKAEITAIEPSDGLVKIEAEACDELYNLVIDKNTSRSGGGNLGGVKPGSYTRYDYLDFGDGASKITINYSRKNGADNGVVQSPDATVKVYIDALPENGGTLVGTISEPPYTATNWATYADLETALAQTVSGIHTVYLVFEGTGPCVINLDHFQFS
ncbi:MAG: GH92 family glycosyl hydrolase [Clostridia bacterium]|nr:GH92 family glycosyl hydrolase [Clostridia bacterium]